MCITPPPSSGSRETAYVADGHKSEARAGQRRRPLTLFCSLLLPTGPASSSGWLQPRDMESINIRRDRALQQPQEREREEKGGGREKCPTEEEEEVRDGEKTLTEKERKKLKEEK